MKHPSHALEADARPHDSPAAAAAGDNNNKTKCSAVRTMDRGMPDFDVTPLVEELKALILADAEQAADKFRPSDVQRVKTDRWATERYLLRCKLDVEAAHKMMRASFEFRASPDINIVEFPREFYATGAVFSYERDRVGNVVLYLRCRCNQKIPLVIRFMKAFLARQIELADLEANGKGIVIVFDLQGVGYSNVDLDFLGFLMSMLSNYFPKGISYFLIHELPWFLRTILGAVRQMLPAEHRELLKFSTKGNITEFVARENLPDFMGGSCKRDYRHIPKTAITLHEGAAKWNLDENELLAIRKKYAHFLPADFQGTPTKKEMASSSSSSPTSDDDDEEDDAFVDAESTDDDKESIADRKTVQPAF